jgi:L-lactate dehydrogenase complex protein LldG
VIRCVVAIAETGTVILYHGPGQGPRALTLVPDFHLVIVRASQIVADLANTSPGSTRPARTPSSSGPSVTSDIELIRAEGAHGLGHLPALLAGP